MIKRIFAIFIICSICLSLQCSFVYANEEYIFYSSPEAYPKSVQDGIKLANEYVLRKTMVCDEENPFFTEWINYRVIENNKEVSGKAYLNNLYKFDEISEDMRLPISLNGKPLTNNVMEYLLDKGFFSIVYQYPLEDWKDKEPRYLGRSISGQRFSNVYFLPDSTSNTTYIKEKNWVEYPWEDEYIYKHFGVIEDLFHQESLLTDPNYQKRLEKLIIKGIEYKINKVAEDAKKYGYNNYFKSKNEGYKNMGDDLYWFNRVVIIQPPTKYTWGLGVIYHKSGGQYWYMDMYIHPDTLVDLNMLIELEDRYTAIMDEEEEYVVIDDAVVNAALDTELIFGAKGDSNADVYVSDVEEFKVVFQTTALNETTGEEIIIIVEGGLNSIKDMTDAEKINILQFNKGISLNTTLKIPVKGLKQGNNKIKLKAEGLITIKNEGSASAEAEKVIELSYIKPVKTTYVLDYDEYTKSIIHPYNKGNAIEATLTRPSPFDQWTSITDINFNRKDLDIASVVDGPVELKGVESSSNSLSVSLYPKIEFKTGRAFLGDNPLKALYHVNGETPGKGFGQEYWGNISRDYKYREAHGKGHDENCPEGCISNHTYYIDRNGTASEDFPSGYEYIDIKAKVYNGTKMAPQSIEKGEEDTGNAFVKKIFWEGDRYEIPVQRYMRNVDADGISNSLVAVDGQFKRLFQHRDTAQVTYRIEKSMAQHFAEDRKAAASGKTKSFKYAPFATDKKLQGLPFPLKSGYNYTPYGVYTATVRTEIYKKGGEKTEHQAIVDSVIKSFGVHVELPTVNLKGEKVTTYPVAVTTNYKKVSDEVLNYKTGPKDINEYLNGDENTLLGNTDNLFKKILEGWSFSGTQNSWTDKKYREYIKTADIHKIVEETTITFTVNPKLEKFNTPIVLDGKNVSDGDYFIRVYFNGFENGHANKVVSSAVNPSSSWTKKYNPNDGWNMVINIRGTRYEDTGYSE